MHLKDIRLKRIERIIAEECKNKGIDEHSIEIGFAVAEQVLKRETVKSATMAGIQTAQAQHRRKKALGIVDAWPKCGSKYI